MNKEFTKQAETAYRSAEQKGAQYFASLYKQLREDSYVSTLSEDIHLWKMNHIHRRSWALFPSKKKRKPDSNHYHKYIRWLNMTGKLDNYLDRSVSYIYMRDLGQSLDSPGTQVRIKQMVADIREQLIPSSLTGKSDQPAFMNLADVYRWAQKEGVETATIWVIEKMKNVSAHIPEGLHAEQAQRKLIKIIIGVILHVLEEMGENTPPAERAQRLDEAIRLGYSYGLTYPFIDDLLDSSVLTVPEKEQYSLMIRDAILTRVVPDLGEYSGNNMDFIRYVHSELREAFEYIKGYQQTALQNAFFEQAFVFFHAQELDRVKELTNPEYTNEELYIPIILKSSSSRLIARSVISAPKDDGFTQRTFFYGLYNQLADDFADMFDDMKDEAVTPYTYYLKYRNQRPDLINPYELYWTVISHLIHTVYHSDTHAREVILDRAINGLKRFKERIGVEKYDEIMKIFASGQPEFNRLIQQMVLKADDVDFFDKLLRDQVLIYLKNNKQEKEDFRDEITKIRELINNQLPIAKPDGTAAMKETLIDAANYCLQGDGKRIRPILAWVMGVNEYGLDRTAIVPLLRSLEYMHTASLIFDDLPSQDNAATRRGRTTLHELYNSSTAELTGLFLIQRSIQEQASLHAFDAKAVLALMQYSAQKAEDTCIGQAMDLNAKGKALTLEQLNRICFYKTGIAFEASLVMPAILAQVQESEIVSLTKIAYHAGIAFQIKDDLLDLEGDQHILGKPTGKDIENNTSTFVSILGAEGARKEMWEHYCSAMEALKEIPRHIPFLKQLLNYMINRER